MDEKYIVQFITLLGAAIISIVMAYRVYSGQVDVVYALVVLLFAIALFFILGRILRKVLNKFNFEIVEKERKEREEIRKAKEEQDNAEEGEDNIGAVVEENVENEL